MLLRNKIEELSFEVVRYEFPNHKSQEKGYDYDANWLVARITYADGTISREYEDACILTSELEELIHGFSKVVSGVESLYISDFLEPYLKFVIANADEDILLGVEFVYDTNDGIWKSHKIASFIPNETALTYIAELKAMLAQFPER